MSQYRVGTVAVTNGSQAIVGTGTAWLANVHAGNVFSIVGSLVPYVVGIVNSDTSITLASPYAGTTASTLSYAITTSYTPNLGIPYPEGGDVDTSTVLKRAMLLIDQDLATPGVTINATSATSLTPSSGSVTFATQTGKQFAYPQYVIAASLANPGNFMTGQVTSYNAISGSLVVNVLNFGGSGAHTDWQISLSGVAGKSINWSGAWSSGSTYNLGDAVSENGSAYICIATNTNNAPPNATYWNYLDLGVYYRGSWVTSTSYFINDVVKDSGGTNNIYICLTAHTSGTLATDVAAAKWGLWVDSASASASATAAAASATTATTEAGIATTQAGIATTQATTATTQATTATTQAGIATTQAVNAATSAAASASSAAALQATSTTSLTPALGTATFTTQSGKQFAAGQWVSATSAANTANNMFGQVTSYSGTTLVVNVTLIGGSGAHTDWNLSIAGAEGPTGATGPGWNQWKGAWSSSTAYIINDTVNVGGSSYICILGNTNNTPPNATYWNVVAAAGSVASVSVTTANGISGSVSNPTTTPSISLSIATQSAGDNTANGATTAFVQTAVNGSLSLSVAGNTNVTLTAVQAAAQIITYTGALTGNITVAVPAAAKTFTVINNTTGAFTLTQIAVGGTGIAVTQGKSQELTCNGTNVILASNDLVGAGIASLAGNTYSGAQNWATPVTLSSAATVAIGAAAANDITISGTTTITAFDTIAAGAYRRLTFSGVLTLTNNTAIAIPGSASVTTAVGDVAEFVSQGSGNWKCIAYNRASGVALVATNSVTAWITKSAAYTAAAGDRIKADTLTIGAFSITFPVAPNDGDAIEIMDIKSNFSTANCSLLGNGKTIMGYTIYACNTKNMHSVFTYDATLGDWRI